MKTNSRDTTSKTYRIENRGAYILARQRMLEIPQSGRLDRTTREAISTFKCEHAITSDKAVDFHTFEAIKGAYRRKLIACKDVSYAPYTHNEELREISEMLRQLIFYYSIPVRLPHGAVYGYDAIRAVQSLRSIYCLQESESIDGELLYYMQKDIRSINAMKKQAIDR